jgi:Winged helix DNA-binding domain
LRELCRFGHATFVKYFGEFHFRAYRTVGNLRFLSRRITAMTHAEIAAFRLARHGLAGRSRMSIENLCASLCGVQAQVMSSAELALWTRNHALRREDVAAALWERRSIVKTSAMRQTLHLVAAPDFALYIAALKRSRMAALSRLLARLGVSDAEAAAMQQLILAALADGPTTQQTLVQRARAKASPRVRRWLKFAWSAFRPSIVQGLICYGPPRGSEVTLVRTDQWLGRQPAIGESEARRELLRRFLNAYSPATVRDFVKWSGIPMSEARPIWDAVSGEMTEVRVDADFDVGDVGARHVPGTCLAPDVAWILKKDARAISATAADLSAVRLLPAFDVYLLAHSAKDHLVEPRFYKRVYRNQGWLSPVVLRGGRIIAVWRLRSAARSQIVEVDAFEVLTKAIKRGIEEEVGALSVYLNAPCSVLFGRD